MSARPRSASRARRTAPARPDPAGVSSMMTASRTGSACFISTGMAPPSTANSGKASSDSQKPTVLA
ncbi:hypothetical protein D3C73_546130 [compost metagenome]